MYVSSEYTDFVCFGEMESPFEATKWYSIGCLLSGIPTTDEYFCYTDRTSLPSNRRRPANTETDEAGVKAAALCARNLNLASFIRLEESPSFTCARLANRRVHSDVEFLSLTTRLRHPCTRDE